MNVYCTLFDSNYLTRGLALYKSLCDTGEDFLLYVFAFDDLSNDILRTMNLPRLEVISMQEFESDELLSLKKKRSKAEYCWTCTPCSILYILEKYRIPEVTYLDADLFFFKKPEVLIEEFHETNCDVMITKHRYSPQYWHQKALCGIYCVQFMTFKNNERALHVLKWWRDRCIECCVEEAKNGNYGDQKYLDDWTERFECIYVLRHLGGGVGPWNVQQYDVTPGPSVNGVNIVFFHYSTFKLMKDGFYQLVVDYYLPRNVVEILYTPYVQAVDQATRQVEIHIGDRFDVGKSIYVSPEYTYGSIMRRILDFGLERIRLADILLLYGAGDVARYVVPILSSIGINNFHVVISENIEGKYMMGNKVHCIEKFISHKKSAVLLLAVRPGLQCELKENAIRLGFKNIVSLT